MKSLTRIRAISLKAVKSSIVPRNSPVPALAVCGSTTVKMPRHVPALDRGKKPPPTMPVWAPLNQKRRAEDQGEGVGSNSPHPLTDLVSLLDGDGFSANIIFIRVHPAGGLGMTPPTT